LSSAYNDPAMRNFKATVSAILLTAISLSIQPVMAQEAVWQSYFSSAAKALMANDPETAEKMFSSAADAAQGFGENDQRYYKSLDGMALALTAQKKFPEAEKAYQKVLSIKEKALGPNSYENAVTMSNYADLLFTEGKYKQAHVMYETALVPLRQANDAVWAEKSQNFGLCNLEEGNYGQAESALKEAAQKESALYGAESDQALSTGVNAIGLYVKKGDFTKAEENATSILKILDNSQRSASPIEDSCLAALSRINVRLAHYAKAEDYAKQIVKRSEAKSDPNSPDYARALQRLAMVYKEEHKYAEAEPLLQKAKALLEKKLPNHPYLADCLVDQAELFIDQGKYDDADALLQRALAIRKSALGSEHSDVAECLIDIAYVKAQQNKPDEAEAAYKRALVIDSKTIGEEHPDYTRAVSLLGLLYASMHNNDEAEAKLSEALRLREKILPPEHPDIARSMAQLAGFYKDTNMGIKAEAMYRRLIARDEKYDPTNVAARTSDLANLAAVMQLLGKPDYATELSKQAEQLRKTIPGGDANASSTLILKAGTSAAAPITDKWCLCIGISNFQDPTINLKYAAKDATDFRNFILTGGNFKEDHVKLLTDAQATRENILSELGDKWLGHVAKPTDLVVIYISSHGSQAMKQAGGTNFLVAYDTNKDSLLSSGIPMQWLSEMVKEQVHSNRILLILDVCHSGSASEGANGDKGITRTFDVDMSKLTAGEGQLVLCSSAADQVSWESKQYPNSVFTHRLIEALQTKGPSTSMTDAYKQLTTSVEQEVLRDRSVDQTPMFKDNWKGGDLSPLKPVN
jgi:tetratricopeptide (TPR) repeat protein